MNLEEVINKAVEKSVREAILKAHPIGSYYFSDDDTDPSLILGGGWRRIKGFFLWGRNTDDSTQTVGLTGGEYAHTLTADEMPAHRHRQYVDFQNVAYAALRDDAGNTWSTPLVNKTYNGNANYSNGNQWTMNPNGGNQPHNNMPPFLATNLWQRIS